MYFIFRLDLGITFCSWQKNWKIESFDFLLHVNLFYLFHKYARIERNRYEASCDFLQDEFSDIRIL